MNLAKLKREQVEVQSTLGLCINGDHVTNILWVDCLMYVVKVGGFATQTDAVVDDLTVDFSFSHVYQGHMWLISCPLVRATSNLLCFSMLVERIAVPCYATVY